MSSGNRTVVMMDPELRYRSAWLAVGWLLVITVCTLTLMSDPPMMGDDIPGSDKFKHTFAYMVLMGWFVQIYCLPRKRLYVGLLLIAMGVTLEFLQGWGGVRVFEYADMAANSLGVLLAWLATRTRFAGILTWFEGVVLR